MTAFEIIYSRSEHTLLNEAELLKLQEYTDSD